MQKMKTYFKMDYSDPKNPKILNEINEGCEWVEQYGIPTRKWDGTACMIRNGMLYKRFDAKINRKTGKRKPIPEGAIPCEKDPDPVTGHWPHWIPVDFDLPENWMHKEAWDLCYRNPTSRPPWLSDGTYELVGPKINGNKDHFESHRLVEHGMKIIPKFHLPDFSFETIKRYLTNHMIEGIVFHHVNGTRKMCKIRRKDFGLEW